MADRFVVEEYERDKYRSGWLVRDTLTGEEVGRDGGEPEDQTLVRDWDWVAKALNKLAASTPTRPTLNRGHMWNCPKHPDRLANKYVEKGPCNCARPVVRTVYVVYRRRDEGFMIDDFYEIHTTAESARAACGDEFVDPDKEARAQGLYFKPEEMYGAFSGEVAPPALLTDEELDHEAQAKEARQLLRLEP